MEFTHTAIMDESSLLSSIFVDRQRLIDLLIAEIADRDSENYFQLRIQHLRSFGSVLNKCAQKPQGIKSSAENWTVLLSVQETILHQAAQMHAEIYGGKSDSKIATVYISPSDGGYPILKNGDLPALTAAKRFQHNSGGPALMVFTDAASRALLATLVVGRSAYHRGNSHYHFEPDEIGKIVLNDVNLYRPQVVLLMPNNVTFFNSDFLRQLKAESGAYIVARFGDPCSYDEEKVRKNLEIARQVDHFIADDGEFADTAHKLGLNNVEYIPPFVNCQVSLSEKCGEESDILFTGAGHIGLKMYGRENMYVRRRNFIQKVDQAFPGRLKVIGKGWGDLNLSGWTDAFISEDEVHRFAQRSKIVIAYDGPYTKGFTSGRTFRALMSGAFLLIRYFPGVENIFVNHRHLVWFHSDDEGLRLIEYYLTNSDEREQIARQGHTYLSEHTGWRRKNIIVDYPLALSHGEKRGFGALFGDYSRPIDLPAEGHFSDLLQAGGVSNNYFNLHDILNQAERNIAMQNYPIARILLECIVAYDPHFGHALNDLAVLHILEGRNDEARHEIEQLLAIDSTNEIALENYQYLQNVYNQSATASIAAVTPVSS